MACIGRRSCAPHTHQDEGAVEVEALSAALGHHDPGPGGCVLERGHGEEQQVQAGVGAQEEQLAAVVVPVRGGQVPRRAPLGLLQGRWLEPVGSAGGRCPQ